MSNIVDITSTDALEFDIEDIENPRSVVRLTSEIPSFQKALKDFLFMDPQYLEMEYDEIKAIANPSFTLSRVRLSFWNEYENAIQHNRKMKLGKIIAGVCTETLFKKKILADHKKLAFVLSPPKDYMIAVKDALDAGLDNLRAIASADITGKDGKIDPKKADVVLKAIALLDMRVKGAIVQKIDQRNLNVNLNKDVTPRDDVPQSVEELDRQIEAAKSRLVKQVTHAKLPEAPQDIISTMKAIDVEVISVGGAKKSNHET